MRRSIAGDNTSEVLEGWYYFYRVTAGVKEDGGWRLAAIFREDREELCLLVVYGKATRRQVESRDSSKESEISAMSSAYSRSDTDTSDVNFFLLPTRSASNR